MSIQNKEQDENVKHSQEHSDINENTSQQKDNVSEESIHPDDTDENSDKEQESKADNDKECDDNEEESNLKPDQKDDLLTEANEKIDQLSDQLLRTAAEFDNFKKRTRKEKTELILNGGEKFITAILPILDDMDRAVANADKIEDAKELEEGWELIFKKLKNILQGMGVHQIETQDKDFDVDYHDAVAMVPTDDEKLKGKVIDSIQTGYMLNEKVIRHAKVAVGK